MVSKHITLGKHPRDAVIILLLFICLASWGQETDDLTGVGGMEMWTVTVPIKTKPNGELDILNMQQVDVEQHLINAFWGAFKSNLENAVLKKHIDGLEFELDDRKAVILKFISEVKQLETTIYWWKVTAVIACFFAFLVFVFAFTKNDGD